MTKSDMQSAPAVPGLHSPAMAYGAAAAAGLTSASIAAVATIHREFLEDIKDIPQVKAHKEKLGQALTDLWERAPGMDRKRYFSELASTKQTHAKELATIVEQHHFRGKTFWGRMVGTFDRSHSMSRNSRSDVIINALLTATVGFCGALMFFNNRGMRHEIASMRVAQPGNDTPQR